LWKCLPYFGRGPWWFEVDTYISRTACDKYWWTNLLYIDNFVPSDYDTTCMGWSWYLANDMQLYILTPLFFFAYYKNKVIGIIVISVAIFGSLLANFLLSFINNYTPWLPALQRNDSYESVVYSKFYTRGVAWLIGVVGAWLLRWHESRQVKLKLPLIAQIIMWLVSAFLITSPVFGTQSLYLEDGQWSKGEIMLYLTFGRFAFTLGVAIMMHMLYTGYGTVINWILSFGLWDVFARLTYSAYLYHPILMSVVYFNSTQFFHYDTLNMAVHFLAFTVLAYIAAVISFLLVERPMMNLERFLLPQHNNRGGGAAHNNKKKEINH